MTAVVFAEEMDVNYTTVMRWLKQGIVPGAELIEPVPGMTVWQIPQSALQMPRPKSGPKRGTKKTGVVRAARKGARAK